MNPKTAYEILSMWQDFTVRTLAGRGGVQARPVWHRRAVIFMKTGQAYA